MPRFIHPPRHQTSIGRRWAQIGAVAAVLYAPPIVIAQIVEHIASHLHR